MLVIIGGWKVTKAAAMRLVAETLARWSVDRDLNRWTLVNIQEFRT